MIDFIRRNVSPRSCNVHLDRKFIKVQRRRNTLRIANGKLRWISEWGEDEYNGRQDQYLDMDHSGFIHNVSRQLLKLTANSRFLSRHQLSSLIHNSFQNCLAGASCHAFIATACSIAKRVQRSILLGKIPRTISRTVEKVRQSFIRQLWMAAFSYPHYLLGIVSQSLLSCHGNNQIMHSAFHSMCISISDVFTQRDDKKK